MNKIKKENLLYRKAIPCSRLFLRKEKTREQAKEVLMLSDSYKSEEDIEKIIKVCKKNNIPVTGNVFLKTAEEIENIIKGLITFIQSV